MTALAVETVVAQLTDAGLNLALAPEGGLAVGPRSQLTTDLRDLIRSSKLLLIDWLKAANDDVSQLPDTPVNAVDWKVLSDAYYQHHFKCPTCQAAGRGVRYGRQCEVGAALWIDYSKAND